MDLAASLFPFGWVMAGNALAILMLAWAAWRVSWRRLDHGAANAWMGACVLVILLWSLKGNYKPGLSFHLLGVAVLTLMMGPWLALLATAVVLSALCLDGSGSVSALGLNLLACGAVPIGVVTLALRLTERYLPPNPFIYIFLNAFVAGGASLAAASLVGIGCLGLAGAYSWTALLNEALPYYFLLSWSEAFISGLMLAILIVYKPQWVASFDDARYLNN